MKTLLASVILHNFFSSPAYARPDVANSVSASTVLASDIDYTQVQSCIDDIRKKHRADDEARAPETGKLVPARESELPKQCVTGDLNAVRQALRRQIAACKNPAPLSQQTTMTFGCRTLSRDQWCLQTNQQMLALANAPHATYQSFMKAIHSKFDWYKNTGRTDNKGNLKKGDVQFTGYDAPDVPASRTPNDEYRYPVYGAPDHLADLGDAPPGSCGGGRPNSCGVDPISGKIITWCIVTPDGCKRPPTRAEIDRGALAGHEIAYVKDALTAMDMEIEGSSTLVFQTHEGTQRMSLNYIGENGWPRNNLSNLLQCAGIPKQDRKNNAAIQRYFDSHPGTEQALLERSPSQVFYREGARAAGYGGVELTPGVSYATDLKSIPLGSVMMVNFKLEGRKGPNGCKSETSMGISQDKGGAIGLAHVDHFAGAGSAAQKIANTMNSPGSLFVAIPKPKHGEKTSCDLAAQ